MDGYCWVAGMKCRYCFKYAWIASCISLALVCLPVSAEDEIRIRPPQSRFDASHSYYVGLLELALQKTEAEYGKGRVTYHAQLNQTREMKELERGETVNVVMVGTSREREAKFIPIRIPLNKGLLGYRVFIIHKDNKALFDSVRSVAELKNLTVCQGSSWPDSDIMEAAGFTVIRNPDYESMFAQVAYKRCHVFPRGINEAYIEMAVRKKIYPDLLLYDRLVLSYPFPMYFFVSPHYPELAQRLEKGLLVALDDGSFDDYLRNSQVTGSVFPVEKWSRTLELRIDNPYLPEKTPLGDARLWLKLPFRQPEPHRESGGR